MRITVKLDHGADRFADRIKAFPAKARQAMAEGFEFVAMARALLREPDLVNRLASQDADRVDAGVCIHCNRCMPTIYSGTRCPVRAEVSG